MSKSKFLVGLIAVVLLAFLFWRSSGYGRGLLALVVIAGLLLVGVQRRRPLLEYLYFCRFPICVGLTLALGPIVAVVFAPLILKNLFVLSFWELVVVTGLAFLASWVVVFTFRLIADLAHERFAVSAFKAPGWFGKLSARAARLFLWLIPGPMVCVTAWLSSEPVWWKRIAAVGLGYAAAWFFIAAAFLGRELLVSGKGRRQDLPMQPEGRLFRSARQTTVVPKVAQQALDTVAGFCAKRPKSLRRGYIASDNRFIPGHVLAATLFTATFLLYAAGYAALRPDGNLVEIPAIAYVLLLLILAAFSLPALSFFLDRFRVPVLLLIFTCSFALYKISNIDHFYELGPDAADFALAKDEPQQVVQSWYSRQQRGQEPVLVAVAASGGGITASLWTAHVLTSLEEAVPGFARSVHLVSAVSGGAVGSMYFVDAYEKGPPSTERLQKVVAAAGSSSLSATTWGLIYPDLWRGLSLPLLGGGIHDRGWAMEQMWKHNLRDPGAMLSSWRKGVLAGWRPAVIFNSTICETGKPLVLAPVHVPGTAKGFGQLYEKKDLPVVTAARLSSTFPWVSPITRARTTKDGYHVADGGYYDNFGVESLVHWMESGLKTYQELGGRKILLIQIRASDPDEAEAGPKDRAGWLYETVGPVQTMFKVRTPLQEVRNEAGLNRLEGAWRSMGRDVKLKRVRFCLPYDSPLSWHLSEAQKREIMGALNGRPDNRRSLEEVKRFFAAGTAPAMAVAAGG